MGREGELQGDLMMTWAEIPRSPGHVFYDRLQKLLAETGFDVRIPTQAGRGYRFEAGQGSDLMPATVPR